MIRRLSFFALLIFLSSFQLKSRISPADYVGPENGYLILCGGGNNTLSIQKLLQLTGKKSPKILIIPTANDDGSQTEDNYTKLKKPFINQGVVTIEILHTRNRDTANSEHFLKKIKTADGVWISGGRQWRLADAYLKTKVVNELYFLLQRGGVIGGSSAGATILGSFLVRGDTKTNTIMEGDHTEGFGFFKNSAIDQHVLQRNRHFDLLEIHNNHPELLCVGLDESTAIVVHQNTMEVIGKHYVTIYDGTIWRRESNEIILLPPLTGKFYFLREGDKYNLLKRRVIIP